MRLASILNQINLSDDPVTTETGLFESQGQSSYSDVHSKRVLILNLIIQKSIWTDGLFIENEIKMKKWKDKIGVRV